MGDEPDNSADVAQSVPRFATPLSLRMGIGSAAEWFDRRNQIYRELGEHGLPPLIGATAQLGRARGKVSWINSQGEPAEYGKPGTYCLPDRPTTEQAQEYFNSVEARFQGPPLEPPATVGEVLALFLRQRLEALKQANNKNKRGADAPVMVAGHLPRSTIAAAASDLLEDCRFHGYPPGPNLAGLLQELLGVDHVPLGSRREFDAQEQAIWILAQDDQISDRELGRRVGKPHTTIGDWRKNEFFQKRIAALRLTIAEVMLVHALRTDEKS